MSDKALTQPVIITRCRKYDPSKDRERMKVYMANKRAKDKAGFQHLTVSQWLRQIATSASTVTAQAETQSEATSHA